MRTYHRWVALAALSLIVTAALAVAQDQPPQQPPEPPQPPDETIPIPNADPDLPPEQFKIRDCLREVETDAAGAAAEDKLFRDYFGRIGRIPGGNLRAQELLARLAAAKGRVLGSASKPGVVRCSRRNWCWDLRKLLKLAGTSAARKRAAKAVFDRYLKEFADAVSPLDKALRDAIAVLRRNQKFQWEAGLVNLIGWLEAKETFARLLGCQIEDAQRRFEADWKVGQHGFPDGGGNGD